MIEAERGVEGRIAIPGAFGVKQYGAVEPDQNILGADITVDECTLFPRGAPGDRFQGGRQIGMHASGGEQIGLKADRMEGFVMGETAAIAPSPAVAA